MKVTITHMKAPWPEGAGVGDTVELQGPVLPAWALGKCVPAADDAEVFAPAKADTQAGGEAVATEAAPRKGKAAKADTQA